MSGSLWFPGFAEYIASNKMKRIPDRLYFSLGRKESGTRNPYMRTVQERTEQVDVYYREQGIDTFFELNPGNHYTDVEKRTAAGIRWLLGK